MKEAYVKPERIWLKSHQTLKEKWVQHLIADEPSILGLGELVLRDQERPQPHAGRLDLLLQDRETNRRYEVELQLGATDESHIIRTIEYWDIERKRYPQYDHCAVLIAEDVTSRFLNVISILNGTIPFIAIQMQAMTVGKQLTIVFTTVVDEMSRGLVDEDEDAPTDRAYWETKASKDTVALADKLLALLKTSDPSLSLRYNKFYIGLTRDGQAFNVVQFRPKKNMIHLEVKLPQADETDALIGKAGLEQLEYNKRWKIYRIRLTKNDIGEKHVAIEKLMTLAYERRTS